VSTVYVNKWGQPVVDKQLSIHVTSVIGTTPGITVPPGYPGNTPQATGGLKASISPTNSQGLATIRLEVTKDVGYRTTQLDGQLYFVQIYDPEVHTPDWKTDAPIQRHLVSVVVFASYDINEHPLWPEVQILMTPYSKLYPGMKNKIDLTNEDTFKIFSLNPPWAPVYKDPRTGPLGINEGAIPYYMTFDIQDPRFMPITRDFSNNRLMTVLHYIKNLQAGQKTAKHKQPKTT